ncbi:MAG: hypothetical protein OHK0048_14610 [Rhodoferax sp.]
MQTPAQPHPPCHAARWRIATIVCLILLAIAAATGASMFEQFKAQIGHLQKKLRQAPRIEWIAVLNDRQHQPAMLITYDRQDGFVQIQRLNDVVEGREDSLQLWVLDANQQPASVGVITPKLKTAQLRVEPATLMQAQALAVSVENKGGVEPTAQPTLPYLYQGRLIHKAL